METKELVKSEVENYAKFDIIRYAQVWEDADVLIEALKINENDNILSIASAGENAIAMLTKNPNKVYAIDLNATQIATCEFKKMCYKFLNYEECMEAIGVFPSNRRISLYNKIKDQLSTETVQYLDLNLDIIERGIINCGKFENYFRIFREKVLPLIHNKKVQQQLLEKKSKEERIEFYNKVWNNLRWKLLFRMFFSKKVMGKLGRDKAFFRYVKTNVAERILGRAEYALTELDTSKNSYLQYILNGNYSNIHALPVAYRKENFEIIKANIDNLILLSETVESFIEREEIDYISKYNLSDIFEYMDDEQMKKIYEKMLTKSPKGSRVAYWNMLADKRASKYFNKIEYLEEESQKLLQQDKAFFYSNFIIEEVK